MGSIETQAMFGDAGDREAGVACAHCGEIIQRGTPVAQCMQCATPHHRACWEARGGCGSYNCAPLRRDLGLAASDPVASVPPNAWKITADELDGAIPLPAPRPPFPVSFGSPMLQAKPMPPSNRRSRMAIATLVVALLGIPLFGVITGVIAIILGCIAISTIQHSQARGIRMAVFGLLLGLADIIGWIVVIAVWQGHHPALVMREPQMDLDPAALKSVDPGIADAMRANVVISSYYHLAERMGSGVVLKFENGLAYIVTNRHVIDGAYTGQGDDDAAIPSGECEVRMMGRGSVSGKVVWIASSGADLAIITVDCKSSGEVRAARYPAASAPKLGDSVYAVGNPHALGWSLSPGSISQIRRWHQAGGDISVIQTTAPINPGNSGGGLYDKDGSLIGINTWTEDKQVSEGIGFAIAIDNLLKIAPPSMLQLQTPKGAEKRSP